MTPHPKARHPRGLWVIPVRSQESLAVPRASGHLLGPANHLPWDPSTGLHFLKAPRPQSPPEEGTGGSAEELL